MTPDHSSTTAASVASLAGQPDWSALLRPGELVVGWFEPDLNHQLRYVRSLVVMTDQRILCRDSEIPAGGAVGLPAGWRAWPLDETTALRASDRSGVGSLELLDHESRLFEWRYTVAQARAAQKLVDQFTAFRQGEVDDESADEIDDAAEPAATTVASPRSLLRLFQFARGRAGLIALGIVLTLLTTSAGLLPVYLPKPLVDNVLAPYEAQANAIRADKQTSAAEKQQALDALSRSERHRLKMVAWYLAALAGAALLAWLLAWAQGAVLAIASERISADLRNTTYAHLQKLSLEFFGGRRTGDLISRISNDTERICNFLSDNLVDFVTDVLMIVGTTALLAAMDPLLAAATLAPLPLIGWLIYYMRDRLQHGFYRGGRAWAEMTSVLADTIPGIRVVKAFAQERREADRFRKANDRVLEANDRVNMVWTFFWPTVAFLNQLGLLVVWACGAWRVFEHQITVGVLTVFVLGINRFYLRLESMSRIFSATQRAAAGAQRIFEILDRMPSVPEPAKPKPLPRVEGKIELRHVGFRYGSRAVLDDVSCLIRPGEMIGLVGPSGSGKSTLVNLVCRFYDVADGAILVDGVDLRELAITDYRRHIGIVLQEPFLFYGTIAENIAYGRPDAARADIIAAARAARAHEFILRLPDGYDSMVGERGQMLSGGERQRISIARAILIDPRILILDEATSSVDTKTEREIQEALDNLVEGRTTIAIAHRLSTLRKADRLVVLERGRVAEVGNHQDLLERDGVYARLHRAQAELAAQVLED